MRNLKVFIPFEKTQKEGEKRRSPKRRSKGKNKYDGEVPVIHGGLAN